MNIFAPILRLFNKGAISNPDTGYQAGAVEQTSTRAGISVTDEQALKISSVWACVQLITNSVTGLPLTVFRETEKGRETLKSRHYLTDLLHSKPNLWMKPRDFRSAMTAQMALFNNAYAEKQYVGDRLVALIPLRPGRMAPFITDSGDLTYHYSTESGVKVFSEKSIFHLKGFGFEGVVGAERNNYARETFGLAASADIYAAKQFANGGRPGGVLTLDRLLTKEQREQVRTIYQGLSEGATNSNKLWVLEGGMKYDALDFNADQMQMIATRSHQIGDIARYFNVPEVLIGGGDKSSSWPASFEQQMLMFLTHTIQPYLDEWESAIRYSLLPTGTNINVDHDASSLVKMDSTALANFLGSNVQNGIMDRNEARSRLNLPNRDGADELTAQTNLTNLENLKESSRDAAQSRQSSESMQSQIRQ